MAYDPNTSVTLIAKPNAGWRFVSWTVNVYGFQNLMSTTMSSDSTLVVANAGEQMNVHAQFEQ